MPKLAKTTRRRLLLIATLGCGLAAVHSPTGSQPFQPSNGRSPVGTNLAEIADYSTQMPFMDAFRSARGWVPRCAQSDPGCTGYWDTGERDLIDLDRYGWPRTLPAPNDAPIFTRVTTLMHREARVYPSGRYVVLYKGEGTLEYGLAATHLANESSPGRDIVLVDGNDSLGIELTITQTDPRRIGNYIRDIHVVPIEFEHRFASETFRPDFIESLQAYRALRFMFWMETNDSTQQYWSLRPQPETASYAWKGAPAEVMVDLSNRVVADPWFTMPHLATDNYMRQFAEIVKRDLDPALRVYVEYSNEVWNWNYGQSTYALAQGKQRWGNDRTDGHMQWYGMKSAQMCDIWKSVFADNPTQVQCVFATQGPWHGLERTALTCPGWVAEGNAPCHEHGFDVYAIGAYFGNSLGSPRYENTVVQWANQGETGIANAFAELRDGDVLAADLADSLANAHETYEYHAGVAEQYGMRLASYEAGQHLVGTGSSLENTVVTDFLTLLNRRPEMGEMYTLMLRKWRDAGGTLTMHFNDIGIPSKFGSWGALEDRSQSHTPKYDALMNYIRETPCWWNRCSAAPHNVLTCDPPN